MSYTEKLKEVGRQAIISYAIGFAVVLVLHIVICMKFGWGFSLSVVWNWFIYTLMLGSLILCFRTADDRCLPGICNSGLGMVRNFGATCLASIFSLNPVLMGIGLFQAMIWGLVGSVILLFVMFCFPLNLINLILMSVLEKSGRNPAEGIGCITESLVPVAGGICSLVVVVNALSGMM